MAAPFALRPYFGHVEFESILQEGQQLFGERHDSVAEIDPAVLACVLGEVRDSTGHHFIL